MATTRRDFFRITGIAAVGFMLPLPVLSGEASKTFLFTNGHFELIKEYNKEWCKEIIIAKWRNNIENLNATFWGFCSVEIAPGMPEIEAEKLAIAGLTHYVREHLGKL